MEEGAKNLRRATDHHESHHAIDNDIFKEYVDDNTDIVGMLAYCFYKIEKVAICEKNPHLTAHEIVEKCREFIKPKKYELNIQKAHDALRFLENEIVSKYAKKKHRRDWLIGIGAGVLSALLAPFLYAFVAWIIHMSGVTNITNPLEPHPQQASPHNHLK